MPITLDIKSLALPLEVSDIDPMDALHAAAAEASECDFLLTCDDRFQKRYCGPIALLSANPLCATPCSAPLLRREDHRENTPQNSKSQETSLSQDTEDKSKEFVESADELYTTA